MVEHKYNTYKFSFDSDPLPTVFYLCEGTRHLIYRISTLVRKTLDYVGYMVSMAYRILKSMPPEHLPGGKWNTLLDHYTAYNASLLMLDFHEDNETAIWSLDHTLDVIGREHAHICCYGTFLCGTNNYKIACEYYARRNEHPEIHPINFVVLEPDIILQEALELDEQIIPYENYIRKELPLRYKYLLLVNTNYIMNGYRCITDMFRSFNYYFTPYRDIVLEKYNRR